MRIGKIGALLFAASIGLSVASCGSPGNKAADSKPVIDEQSADPNVKKAVVIYKEQCLVCHGSQLEGRMGSRTNMTKIGAKLTADEIRSKILKGGGGMIGYKDRLSSEEVTLLTNWLASKK